MVSEAEKDGELTNRESELIRSAIEFDDVEAQDVLTPRVDVIAVADDAPMDEVTETLPTAAIPACRYTTKPLITSLAWYMKKTVLPPCARAMKMSSWKA